jgi:tellurite resistance protein
MAIEMAPPAVAGLAYFALSGGALDPFSYGLAGFAVLMAVVQLRLIPVYAKLKFSPGFWAFTFSYAAAASDALEWIARKKLAGATAFSIAIVVLITTFIVVIAIRTVLLASRGQLLVRSPL